MYRYHLLTLSLILVATSAGSAQAQDVSISATVEPQSAAVGEIVTYELSVTIAGASALSTNPQPQLPDLKGFEIVSTGTRRNVVMDGDRGLQVTAGTIYRLRAVKPGSHTIGSATVDIGGRSYHSNTVLVNVTPAPTLTPPPAPGQPQPPVTPPSAPTQPEAAPVEPGEYVPSGPVDLVLTPDRKRPYVGEQVTLTFTFYRSRTLAEVSYEAPSAHDFVLKELQHPDAVERVYGTTLFAIHQRRWAAFATAAGRRTVQPVVVTLQMTPYDTPRRMQTNPLEIDVRPLPSPPGGRPFEGAVGKFAVDMTADRDSVKAGDSLTLSVFVRGTGNIHALGVPEPQLPDWVKVYPSREDRQSAAGYGGDPDVVGGEARFDFLILPRREGTLTIPAFEYLYFDPASERYQTARAPALTVSVQPGDITTAPDAGTAQALRHIMPGGPGTRRTAPIFANSALWAAQLLPPVMLALVGYRVRRAHRLKSDPRLARALGASRVARAQLDDARRALAADDGDAFCTSVYHAITDYILHRAGMPARDISSSEAIAVLTAADADRDLLKGVAEVLRHCDYGRFAGGGRAQCADVLAEARSLIDRIGRLDLQKVRP